jgi:exosortase
MAKKNVKRNTTHRLRRQLPQPTSNGTKASEPKPVPKATEKIDPLSKDQNFISVGIVALILAPAFLWAYWPTLVWMESLWRNEPDYSHGYLILPLAGLIAYARWDLFPGVRPGVSWQGVSLLIVAIAIRIVGRFGYMDFLDGWSLLPWFAGVAWMLLGRQAMRWALPSIGFLFLLVPLPFQAESLLSWKLQGVATEASTALLRVLGQPAVAEGHTIWLGQTQLMVEDACSGLRIFVGIGALAFFWASVVRRSWIDRFVILGSVLPLAIVANVLRVTTVALFSRRFDGVSLDRIHDWVGIAMIAVAALMLWGVKVYWEMLYRPVETVGAQASFSGVAS